MFSELIDLSLLLIASPSILCKLLKYLNLVLNFWLVIYETIILLLFYKNVMTFGTVDGWLLIIYMYEF